MNTLEQAYKGYDVTIFTEGNCVRNHHFEAVDTDAAWDIALSEAFKEGEHVGVLLEDSWHSIGYRKTRKDARDWLFYADIDREITPWLYKVSVNTLSFQVHTTFPNLRKDVQILVGEQYTQRPMYYECFAYPITEASYSQRSGEVTDYVGFLDPDSEDGHMHRWRRARGPQLAHVSRFLCKCGVVRLVHWEMVDGVLRYAGLTTDHRRLGAKKSA